MSASETHYDVIIVGGGLSGLALSCLLGRQGIRVACIDQMDPKTAISADLRTTAISYGSSKILEEAGIWPLPDNQICAIEDIEILDGSSPVLLQFLSEEIEGRAFGWIVLNSDLRTKMMECAQSLNSHVHHIAPARVQGYEIAEDKGYVDLEDGQRLSANLVLGADGRGSGMRDFMQVQKRQFSYKQQAVVCTVGHERPHNNCAVEHFWPEGPFAVLPMADDEQGQHRSAVVFTEHTQGKDSWMNYSDTVFETALTRRFPERYGKINMLSQRACYPLSLVHAASYTAPRMALVADAAHGIHPIAGQGLNLGFRDLKTLSDLLSSAHAQRDDLGSAELLDTYEKMRRPDNMAMVAFTDGLVRLFSNRSKTLGFARRLGLRAVSKLPPAKRFFMKKAMGEG